MSKRKVREENRMSLWRTMKGGTDFARCFSIYVVSSKKSSNSSHFAGTVTLHVHVAAMQAHFFQNKAEGT